MNNACSSKYVKAIMISVALLVTRVSASDVTATVQSATKNAADTSGIVVSLNPLDRTKAEQLKRPPIRATLTQKNKEFLPHVLVIPPGSVVQFPNHDPFFHNVFSLFEGKRFDLGLYESGSTRSVTFDRPGVSYIFCNIHPQMNAIVIALDTPYYALADKSGNIKISGVEPGHYVMQVWAEGLNTDEIQKLSRPVTVAQDVVDLGKIEVPSVESLSQHKNKYGRDYDLPGSNAEYVPR